MRQVWPSCLAKPLAGSKGKAGMMGLHAAEHNHWVAMRTAATQTALAAGLGFGLKHRGETGAVFCSLGDGAVNQGTFHESLNLAGLFSLPVIFII